MERSQPSENVLRRNSQARICIHSGGDGYDVVAQPPLESVVTLHQGN